MDRLTGRDRNGEPMLLCAYVNDNHCADCYDCGHFTKLVDRLAAYENTGLEPEEVKSLKETWDLFGGADGVQRVYVERDEYKQAESEGRLIVLPCKVGDTVYQTDGVRIYESTIRKIIYDTGHFAFDDDAIGHSVFLTREEAEAALGGDGDGC